MISVFLCQLVSDFVHLTICSYMHIQYDSIDDK